MKAKRIFFIIAVLSITLLVACKKEELQGEVLEMGEIEEVEEEEVVEVEREGVLSPLSGLYEEEEKINRRPIAIMFDNHPRARWQAGIGKAEVVYEFLVEAPYTRYMGIFLAGEPESIGPIRSARPYFITALLEYDPVYVRVGGSAEAKKDVKDLKLADIDSLSAPNRVLWRNNQVGKSPPHNTYTSMEVIRSYQAEKSYRDTADYEGFTFYEEDVELSGDPAKDITINYYPNNSTRYNYNEEEKLYYRHKDGEAQIDELDNSNVTAKNIIIQEASSQVVDNEGRLKIALIGEGKARYFTNGRGIDIRWSKKSRSSKTYFQDEQGREIILNPGNTWIQVVNPNPNLEIN